MEVYLASRYGRLEEMRNYRARLLERGIEVTSRWLDGAHQIAHDNMPLGAEREHLVESQEVRDLELKAHFAQQDMHDLARADTVIVFTETPEVKGRGRGGRHVELGFVLGLRACGLYHRIILIGHRENIFYCMPYIEQVRDFDEALALLDKNRE